MHTIHQHSMPTNPLLTFDSYDLVLYVDGLRFLGLTSAATHFCYGAS